MIGAMNLGQVILAWNIARREAGLSTLTYSANLSRYAVKCLQPWAKNPASDPEAVPNNYESVLVIMSPAAGWTPTMVAQGLLGAPYHRGIILDPAVSRIGIAEVCSGKACIVQAEFSGPPPKKEPPFVLWIPPTVPGSWQDYEYPSPFGLSVGATVGYPLSVFTDSLCQVRGAEITQGKTRIPTYLSESNFDGTVLVIAPKSPLPAGKYTLSFWWEPTSGKPRHVSKPFVVH